MSRSSLRARIGLVAFALAFIAPAALAQTLPDRPVGKGPAPLSSSEVSDAEIESAAAILVALDRQRTQLENKYGEPDDMTDAERRQAQRDIVRERQYMLQRKTVEEDLDAGRLELIVMSAQKDSTLRRRLEAAIEKERGRTKQRPAPETTQDPERTTDRRR